MRSNLFRTGKQVYKGVSNSPNFKGATAVKPNQAFAELQKRNDPNQLRRAMRRRLGV